MQIRNLSLYPAELRGQRSFQPFMEAAPKEQAEQNGASGHSAARQSHNLGHKHNRHWKSSELRTMREMRRAGATRKEIAAAIGRSELSVKAQIGRFRETMGKRGKPVRPLCPCCKRPL